MKYIIARLINNFGNQIKVYFRSRSFPPTTSLPFARLFTRKQGIHQDIGLHTKSYRRPTLSVLPPTSLFGKSTTANPLAGLVFRRTPHIPSTVSRARSARLWLCHSRAGSNTRIRLSRGGIDLSPSKSFRFETPLSLSRLVARVYDNLPDLILDIGNLVQSLARINFAFAVRRKERYDQNQPRLCRSARVQHTCCSAACDSSPLSLS